MHTCHLSLPLSPSLAAVTRTTAFELLKSYSLSAFAHSGRPGRNPLGSCDGTFVLRRLTRGKSKSLPSPLLTLPGQFAPMKHSEVITALLYFKGASSNDIHKIFEFFDPCLYSELIYIIRFMITYYVRFSQTPPSPLMRTSYLDPPYFVHPPPSFLPSFRPSLHLRRFVAKAGLLFSL